MANGLGLRMKSRTWPQFELTRPCVSIPIYYKLLTYNIQYNHVQGPTCARGLLHVRTMYMDVHVVRVVNVLICEQYEATSRSIDLILYNAFTLVMNTNGVYNFATHVI